MKSMSLLHRLRASRASRASRSHRVRPLLCPLEARIALSALVAVGTDKGVPGTVRVFADTDRDGRFDTLTADFQPFGAFKGGVRGAMGDFNGDGNDELATATGAGQQAAVAIWGISAQGSIGPAIEKFFPFPGFSGGVFVAAGDVNSDGRDDLVVSTGTGRGLVQIFS